MGSTRTATSTATAPPPVDLDNWPILLAPRLFSPPVRWGWEAAAPVEAPKESKAPAPPPRPTWNETPAPDASALRRARSKAVSRLIWRIALTAIIVVAFLAYQISVTDQVAGFGGEALTVFNTIALVAFGLLVVGIVRGGAAVGRATKDLRDFEGPYLAARQAERERYENALAAWERAVNQHSPESVSRAADQPASGIRWYPVGPRSEPTRIDIFGGDARRHGWASLLVTLGTSILAKGERITLVDLTGQDVGGGLEAVAAAQGMATGRADQHLGDRLDLLHGSGRRELAQVLSTALTARREGEDRREDRILAGDVLRRVLDTLEEPLTFERLAAAVRVLHKGDADDHLSSRELGALIGDHLGDIDQGEWTGRQLRLLASQLDSLHEITGTGGAPLWPDLPVFVVATEGGRTDRKELIDRVLLQLAEHAMGGGRLRGVVVVAGVDHLGTATVHHLSERALRAGVRLVVMFDQLQGAIEGQVGTGGAVCIMKLYNHRDANAAAEFIGRGHKFVLSQVSRQVGSSFTETGGDSFGANTGTVNNKARFSGAAGRRTGLSDSRGHTWTGTRSWSGGDSISTTDASSRVYEFLVEPQEILGMPETAFVLVDNTGSQRRVVLADGNPGICMLERIAPAQR